jgi:hypothetical protein
MTLLLNQTRYTLAPPLRATYPRRVEAIRRGPPLRFYPENVKGRPLFPRDGYSRMCS